MPDELLPAELGPADWREAFNEWQLREIERAEHYVKILGYGNLDRTSYGTIYRLVQMLDAARHKLANVQSKENLDDYIAKRKAEIAAQIPDLDDTQEIATQ